MKVLVADNISDEGLSVLRQYAQVDVRAGISPEELEAAIGDYEGLMVRSRTQVTSRIIEAGKKLQVIGRAGVGVDNIDVEAATRCGVMVVNAPTGNTISAAEHTIALMLSLARHIPEANASLKSGAWQRSKFTGNELRNKTLGIIGLGNVGSAVARRARAFEMKLIGYDPLISADYAQRLQVELVEMTQLLKESDFVTLHIPLTERTKGLIGEKELALMKPSARLINCARGGLVDEAALAKAVSEKKLAGAAVDVFPVEPPPASPLFTTDGIIVTPHLGASTREAQITAARDVAEQFVSIIKGEPVKHALNAPSIPPEELATLAPYANLATMLARLVYRLADGQTKDITIKYEGEISTYDTTVLKAAILEGLLENVSEERINLVNVNIVAAQRGLSILEQKEAACENYASMIMVRVATTAGATAVAGTVLRGEPHIVKVNEYWLDIAPAGGYFLFSDHRDRPGLISAVSRVIGDADVNISAMHVGRLKPRGRAIMVLALDEPLAEKQLSEILATPDVYSAKLVKL